MKRLVLVAVAVSLLARPAAPPDAAAKVDALFAQFNKPDSPGCSLGVSQNGSTVYEHGYGMANIELGVPIAPDMVFHAASISKQFTAMSILLLVQRGQVSLDDEARKYVTELPDYGTRLTIRHLLSHTSGLRDAFLILGISTPGDHGMDPAELVIAALTRQRGMNFTPGSDFRYNNGGYTMLGGIVHRVSGQTLRAFADANIFKPLGMTKTHFHDDASEIVPRRAYGYRRVNGVMHRALRTDTDSLVGNAGLMTTAGDLLRWEQNFDDKKVGDPRLLEQMQTPMTLTGGEKAPYGFGLFIGERHGLKTVSHGGGDQGISAYVIRYPERRLAISILCNSDDINSMELSNGVADLYLPAADVAKPASSSGATTVKAVSLSPEQQAAWVGLYRSTASETFGRIMVRDGKLVTTTSAGTDGDTYPWTPVSTTKLVLEGTEVVAERLPTPPGQPREVRITGDGPKAVVMREVQSTFAPSAAELKAFAGEFASSEIEGQWTISVKDTGLLLHMPGMSDTVLRPIFKDAFQGGAPDVMEFIRDGQGGVTGFTVNAGGAQGIRFDRVTR